MDAPASQSRARRGRADRLQTLIGLAIVVVSVASAVVTWRAAETAARASDLDAQTRQGELLRSQRVSLHRADVAHDERLAVVYLGHVDAAEQLEAAGQHGRAQEERAIIRALHPMFLYGWRLEAGPGGEWTYRRQTAFIDAVDADPELKNVRPRQLRRLTDQARTKRVHLIAVDTGFIASLFILTLAQLARQRHRQLGALGPGLAAGGVLLAVVATVFFVGVNW